MPARGVRVLINRKETSFYRDPVRTWTAMISVSELVHTFGIGRNYNLARTSYVTDGHISISSQDGKVQPPLRFCKVSGGPSIFYVIGLPSSHILHERHSNLARTYASSIYHHKMESATTVEISGRVWGQRQ